MNNFVCAGAAPQWAQDEMSVEIELNDLELAYVGGGIGDVVGH